MSTRTERGGGGPSDGQGGDEVLAALFAWLESGLWTDTLERARADAPAAFERRLTLARALLARLGEARWPAPSDSARRAAVSLLRDAAATSGEGAPSTPEGRATRGTGDPARPAPWRAEGLGSGLERVWRTLRAALVGGEEDLALAYRSAGRAPFFALYAVEGYDIDVTLSEHGTLLGQVLPVGEATSFHGGLCHVVALDGSTPPSVAPIGPDGDFALSGPFAPAVELVLELDEPGGTPTRLVIERLELAHGGDGGLRP